MHFQAKLDDCGSYHTSIFANIRCYHWINPGTGQEWEAAVAVANHVTCKHQSLTLLQLSCDTVIGSESL